MTDVIGFSYASLVALGGVIGYLKAGSAVSLAAGLGFGLLSAYGAYLTSQNPSNVMLALGASGTLAVVMGMRFARSGRFMPAGLVFVLSLANVTRLGLRLYNHNQ